MTESWWVEFSINYMKEPLPANVANIANIVNVANVANIANITNALAVNCPPSTLYFMY